MKSFSDVLIFLVINIGVLKQRFVRNVIRNYKIMNQSKSHELKSQIL